MGSIWGDSFKHMGRKFNKRLHQAQSFSGIFQQMVPHPNIDRITIHGGMVNTAPLKVNLLLTLKDFVDPSDELVSSWFRNLGNNDPETSSFEEFVKIQVIQCTNRHVYMHLRGVMNLQALKEAGIDNIDDHLHTRRINLKEKIPLDLDPETDSTGLDEFKHFDEQGREVLFVPIEEVFKAHPAPGDNNGIEHLSYFVWADLDMPALAQSLDVQERFFSKIKLKRYVAVESVIENYNLVLDTVVYLMPDGTEWNGPVHYHAPDNNPLASDPSFKGYMTGIEHTEDSVKLVSSIQPNPKIRDMRASTRVDERYRSVMQQRLGAGLVEGAALVGQAVEEHVVTQTTNDAVKLVGQKEIRPEKPSAIFTSLLTSTDEMHNVSGLFGLDWIGFLKQNCAFPWLFDVSGPTTQRILQLASINNLTLYRKQVNPKSRDFNRVGTPYLARMSKKYNKSYRWLGSTSEKRPYSMGWQRIIEQLFLKEHNTNNKVRDVNTSRLFLKEVKIHSTGTSDGLRWFTFTDRGVIEEKNGVYQYTVHMESKDPTVALLLSQYRKLGAARKWLAQYLYYAQGYTAQKPNYDIYLDRFIPEFIETFSINADNRVNYWQQPLNDYLNVLNTISNTLQQAAHPGASYTLETTLPATLASYSDPRKGSPEGIAIALSMFDKLLKTIKDHLSSIVPRDRRGSRKSGVRKSHVRRRGGQRTLRILQTFDNEVVLDGKRGKGYDYLTSQDLQWATESIKGKGLRILSSRYYRNRCDVETKRYFAGSEANWSYTNLLRTSVPDITLSREGGDDSLKTSKFSYFTPSFVFSSPGIAMGNAAFSAPSFGPPQGGTGRSTSGGATSLKVGATAATSYLGSNKTFDSSISKMMAPVNLIPLGLQMKLNSATATTHKTLDDVAADLLAAQGDPDFNLYPKNIKAFEVPAQKNSKVSPEEQKLKAKYAAVLAGKGCIVVPANEEFGDVPLLTREHPEGFDIKNFKYKPTTLDLARLEIFTNLSKVLYINQINPLQFRRNTYSLQTPFYKPGLSNLKSLSLLAPAANSVSGIKPAFKGFKSPVGFGSVHVGNLKLLNFGNTSNKTILDTTNPSNKIAKLKALPNQLKSLVLAGNSQIPLRDAFEVKTTERSATTSPEEAALSAATIAKIAPLFQPKNINAAFQLYKNIIRVEYLDSFSNPSFQIRNPETGKLEKTTGTRPLLRDPQWVTLTENVLQDLEDEATEKTSILCRIVRYVNPELGIGHSTKLDLPIIDKHFIILLDPDAEDEINWSFDWGNWVTATRYSGGHSAETMIDARDLDDDGRGNWWKIKSPHDESEITVKEFEGSVLVGGGSCGSDGEGGLP